ncbi:MAG: DDE-type integrase/transposase/recombinase [Candidatus Nanopelagicales bacterium]
MIAARIAAGWQSGASVDHSFATAWDDAVMLASRRSWWRIAAQIPDQSSRPIAPTRRSNTNRVPRAAPVLEATGPGQVWSWDITDLPSPWRGVAYKAYSVMDIFSRKIVAWRLEEREVDDLAVEMFKSAFGEHGIPAAVHADSGPAMRSNVLANLLDDLGITRTHNRPRVSNDNPFSEAEFRTMKYRPNYPGTFTTIDQARAFMDRYVPWYNQHHKHSGIALFSPDEVHDGTWHELWDRRRTRSTRPTTTSTPNGSADQPRTPSPARHRRHQPPQGQRQRQNRQQTTPPSLTFRAVTGTDICTHGNSPLASTSSFRRATKHRASATLSAVKYS